jgi:hypothetical protein
MTSTDWHGMAKNSQTLRPRERLGWFLRTQYPGIGRDKRLASDLAVSARTARNLFEDHWPSDDTFAAVLYAGSAIRCGAFYVPRRSLRCWQS